MWRPDEDELIRASAGAKTATEVGNLLDRNCSVVWRRARKLGVELRQDKSRPGNRVRKDEPSYNFAGLYAWSRG